MTKQVDQQRIDVEPLAFMRGLRKLDDLRGRIRRSKDRANQAAIDADASHRSFVK
jgi:hypothetical protein